MPKKQILNKFQKQLLIAIGRNKFSKNIYWAGGTALAYRYFNHRYSLDLDFFSDDLFRDEDYLIFINQIKKEIGADKIKSIIQQNRRIYLIKGGKDELEMEIVYFPFPALGRRESLKEFSIKVDSLKDIMTNKTLSIYQREETKDIYDLYYYLSKKQGNLLNLIKLVEKKFGLTIEPTLLISKINQSSKRIDDIQPFLLKKERNLSSKVKSFFQNIFNSLLKKQIK